MKISHGHKNKDNIIVDRPPVSRDRLKRGVISHGKWMDMHEVETPVPAVAESITETVPTPVVAKEVSAPAVVEHPVIAKQDTIRKQEKMVSKLDQGVIVHEMASLTADSNNTRTFHFDPDVPHVVHDKNMHEKNYTEVVRAPIVEGEENDAVVTHTSPSSKLSYLETTNPHEDYTGPQSVTELNLIFGDDIKAIVEALLSDTIDFTQVDVEFSNPNFAIIDGEEGLAPATETTPFVLRSPHYKGISYLVNTMMAEFKKMNLPEEKLIEVLTEMLEHSAGVKEWLGQIILLWNEVKS